MSNTRRLARSPLPFRLPLPILVAAALAVLVGLAGCAGSNRGVNDPINTLDDVNAELKEERAFIHLRDGRVIEDARRTQVTRDSVTYWTKHPPEDRPPSSPLYGSAPGERRSVPTDSVDLITSTVSAPAPYIGSGIGAAPGLALGIHALTLDCETLNCSLGQALGVTIGAIAAAGGAIIGAVLGNVSDPDREVVYTPPVERYLSSPAPETDRTDGDR